MNKKITIELSKREVLHISSVLTLESYRLAYQALFEKEHIADSYRKDAEELRMIARMIDLKAQLETGVEL